MRLIAAILFFSTAPLGAACGLDGGFGSGGYSTYPSPSGGGSALGRDLVALSDGRLLVAGTGARSGNADVDAAWWCLFNAGGVAGSGGYHGIGGGDDEEFYAAAEVPGASGVVLAGVAFDAGGNTKLALLRLSLPGLAPDAGFGSAGWVTMTAASGARGVAVDAAGRVYTIDDGGLKRWTSAGALDSSWGSGGNLVFDAAGAAWDLRMDSLGRLVLAGANSTGLAVWRVLGSGGLDPGFGTGGRVQRSFGGAFDIAGIDSLVIDATDAVLALGGSFNAIGVHSQWLAWSLGSGGVPDSGFGSSGLAQGVTVSSFSGIQLAEGALGNGGNWMLLGRHPGGLYEQPALWAMQADGSLDPGFGTGGQSLPVASPGNFRRARMLGSWAFATGGLGGGMVLWRLAGCSLGGAQPTPTPVPTLAALSGAGPGTAVVYPNPAKDKVWVAVAGAGSGLRFKVYDEMGRQVGESQGMFGARAGYWELGLSGYAPGVYFITFSEGAVNPPPAKFVVLP